MAEADAYRIYIADTLKSTSEGKRLQQRWSDLLRTPANFDADEIMEQVIERAGLEVN